MKIQDVMTTHVHLIGQQATLREAATMMRDNDIGSLPVHSQDRLQGMLTDRDLVVRGLAEGLSPDSAVANVMSEGIEYCFDDEQVDEVASRMADLEVRRLPVVNREKQLVGFVSLANINASDDTDAVSTVVDGTAQAH